MYKQKLGKLIIILLISTSFLIPSNVIASNEVSVVLESKELSFDVPPQIINGRTMLPLRVIFESFGLEVIWDDKTKVIEGLNNEKTIILTVGDKNASVNGVAKELDVPPLIIEGRTLVPVRFIAESMNKIVEWDQTSKTVYIDNKSNIVSFKDPFLEEIIRTMVNKPNGDMYPKDVYNITEITYSDTMWKGYTEIKSLEGIENLTNLKLIEIENALIEDISPLAKLSKLEEISLPRNNIVDIKPIENLVGLKKILFSANKIEDISVIENLPNLQSVAVADNKISDISVLGTLPKLQKVYIGNNQINEDSYTSTMEILLRKGVEGYHDYYGESMEFSDTSPMEKVQKDKQTILNSIDENSTEYEVEKFLNENLSVLDTVIGTTTFKFKVFENYSENNPEDFMISVDFELSYFWDAMESIKYTSSEKKQLKNELKEHQKSIAETLIELMPGKKLSGSYHTGYYKYPLTRAGYTSWNYYSWQNFNDYDYLSDTPAYYQTKPSNFRWMSEYDDEL